MRHTTNGTYQQTKQKKKENHLMNSKRETYANKEKRKIKN